MVSKLARKRSLCGDCDNSDKLQIASRQCNTAKLFRTKTVQWFDGLQELWQVDGAPGAQRGDVSQHGLWREIIWHSFRTLFFTSRQFYPVFFCLTDIR
jgi:hypothetical protein